MNRVPTSILHREAILDVLGEYGFIMDSRRWDRLGEVFLPDGVFDASALRVPVCTGLEAMATQFAAMQHPVAHHMTNPVFAELKGDRAEVRSKYLGPMRGGRIITGEYRDSLRLVDAGWRIAARVVTAGLPDAQTLEPPSSWRAL